MDSSESNILISLFFQFLEAFKSLLKSNYSTPTLQLVEYLQIPHSGVLLLVPLTLESAKSLVKPDQRCTVDGKSVQMFSFVKNCCTFSVMWYAHLLS